MSQTDRLIRYLRDHPGSTSLEITVALGIVNVTGRISDLRGEGLVIECRKRRDRHQGYWVVEPGQRTLGLA